jgi:hypothetical protein
MQEGRILKGWQIPPTRQPSDDVVVVKSARGASVAPLWIARNQTRLPKHCPTNNDRCDNPNRISRQSRE